MKHYLNDYVANQNHPSSSSTSSSGTSTTLNSVTSNLFTFHHLVQKTYQSNCVDGVAYNSQNLRDEYLLTRRPSSTDKDGDPGGGPFELDDRAEGLIDEVLGMTSAERRDLILGFIDNFEREIPGVFDHDIQQFEQVNIVSDSSPSVSSTQSKSMEEESQNEKTEKMTSPPAHSNSKGQEVCLALIPSISTKDESIPNKNEIGKTNASIKTGGQHLQYKSRGKTNQTCKMIQKLNYKQGNKENQIVLAKPNSGRISKGKSAYGASPYYRSKGKPNGEHLWPAIIRPSQTSFPCPDLDCSKEYSCKNGLKYHLQHYHLTPAQELQLRDKQQNPQFACPHPLCTKRYMNKSGLNYHLKTFDHNKLTDVCKIEDDDNDVQFIKSTVSSRTSRRKRPLAIEPPKSSSLQGPLAIEPTQSELEMMNAKGWYNISQLREIANDLITKQEKVINANGEVKQEVEPVNKNCSCQAKALTTLGQGSQGYFISPYQRNDTKSHISQLKATTTTGAPHKSMKQEMTDIGLEVAVPNYNAPDMRLFGSRGYDVDLYGTRTEIKDENENENILLAIKDEVSDEDFLAQRREIVVAESRIVFGTRRSDKCTYDPAKDNATIINGKFFTSYCCAVRGCPRWYKRLGDLRGHIRRFHDKENSHEALYCKCGTPLLRQGNNVFHIREVK